jgi:hypothetical protein
VVAPAVLLGCEVHELEMRAVLAVALLGGLLDQQVACVVGATDLRLVGGVEEDHRDVDEAARVDLQERPEVVEARAILDQRAHQVAHREAVAARHRRDRREADVSP